MLIDMTVKPTSRAPSSAACIRGMPASMWREMFSSTTIASSTTKPVAIVSAINDRLSRLKPSRYIAPNVPMIETGTATLGMSGGAQIAKEQEHDEGDQGDRDDQRAFGVGSEVRIVVRAVQRDGQVDIAGQRGGHARQLRLHRVDGLDDVGAGLAVENDQHRGLAVGEAGVAQIFDRIDDLADVGQLDRRIVAVGDDEVAVLGGVARLVVGVDLVVTVAVLDGALRAVGVGGGERGAHVFEPDAVFEQGARVELDAHRRQGAAADVDFADALHLRQPLLHHGGGGIVELAGVRVCEVSAMIMIGASAGLTLR